MQDVRRIVDDLIFNLKLDRLSENRLLMNLSKKTHVAANDMVRLAVGAFTFIGLSIMFVFAHNFVYFLLSVLYPAFLTAKTTINEDIMSRDGKLYLSYWVCFGFLTLFNQFFGFVLRWVPFSKLAQCLFTVWLYNERTRGAEYLNRTFLQPIFSKYGGKAKQGLEKAKDNIQQHNISQ